MGDFDEEFVEELKVQSWALYSVGMFIIAARMFARIHRLGIKGLQLDDYLMMLAAGLYTALVVCLNTISQGGGSNLYPPEMTGTFTPEEVEERIYGSKIVVVSEQAMLNVIYVIKSCMLIMYTRLTLGLTSQKAVRYLAFYVATGWLATQIAFFTACRPFQGYWAMPPPNPQCTTLEHYAIVQGCFNITSDLLMLCIPLPLVLRMRLPWKQKLVLLFIFSMGLFVIVAAMLTKIFNLTDVWNPVYMLWYVRESSVAVFVANLPMIWPLMREWFPCLRTLTQTAGAYPGSSGLGSSAADKRRTGGASASAPSRNFSHKMTPLPLSSPRSGGASIDSIEIEMKGQTLAPRRHGRAAEVAASSSTEEIVRADHSDADDGASAVAVAVAVPVAAAVAKPAAARGIHVTVERTVVVQEQRARSGMGFDVERGLFDWDRTQHRFTVSPPRR